MPIGALGIKAVIASLALLAHLWLARRPIASGAENKGRIAAIGVLMAAATAGFLHYTNLPPFHPLAARPLHVHDFAHYYLGAKYFPELGYRRLYRCFLEADDGQIGARTARDLETLRQKVERPVDELLADPMRPCRIHFSAFRWTEFRNDVHALTAEQDAAAWRSFVGDLGFNAPPGWLVMAHPVAQSVGSLAPGVPTFERLTLLDTALLAATFGVLVAGFGMVPAATALVVLTTFHPASSTWTAGSFLRWDWLFFLALGATMARRGYPAAAGAMVAWSALLRVFPAIALFGVVAWIAVRRFIDGCWPRPGLAFLGGAVLAGLGGSLASVALFGVGAWIDAWDNLIGMEASTPTNYMGLGTAISYAATSWSSGQWIVPDRDAIFGTGSYPFVRTVFQVTTGVGLAWILAQLRTPTIATVILLVLILLPWSGLLLPNYYYMVWCLPAVLCIDHRWTAVTILGTCLASLALAALLGRSVALFSALSALAALGALVVVIQVGRRESAS